MVVSTARPVAFSVWKAADELQFVHSFMFERLEGFAFQFFPTNVYYTQLLSTRFKLLLLLINSAVSGFCLLFVYYTLGIERAKLDWQVWGVSPFLRQTDQQKYN